jgi:hypothetical protein
VRLIRENTQRDFQAARIDHFVPHRAQLGYDCLVSALATTTGRTTQLQHPRWRVWPNLARRLVTRNLNEAKK